MLFMPEILKSMIVFHGIQIMVNLKLEAGKVIIFSSSSINHLKVDDFSEIIPTDFISSEVVNKGLYVDYTVELDLALLALNAIIKSDELKNIDAETSKFMESQYS